MTNLKRQDNVCLTGKEKNPDKQSNDPYGWPYPIVSYLSHYFVYQSLRPSNRISLLINTQRNAWFLSSIIASSTSLKENYLTLVAIILNRQWIE